MKVEFVSATDIGRARPQNEDAIGDPRSHVATPESIVTHGYLFAVADGMGGHESGEVASAIAVSTLFRSYYLSGEDCREALSDGFAAANDAVHSESQRRTVEGIHERSNGFGKALPLGTTLVAAALIDHVAIVGNVGDSRAYIFHGRVLQQITVDHSLIGEQIRRRVLTASEATHALYRNVLLRAVGLAAEVDVDIFEVPIVDGDVLLLSSDGLHGVVSEKVIGDALFAERDLGKVARRLIDRANDIGGPDNISVVIARAIA